MPTKATRPAAVIPADRVKHCRNAAAIARDFGTTRQAVVQWQQRGCPSYLTPDGGRLYDTGDVFWWVMERDTGKTKAEILAGDDRRAALRRKGRRCTCGASD